jgi:MFS family permease
MTSPGTASISLNGGQRWRAFWVCVSVAALTILDLSKVNVALPSIEKALGAGSTQLQIVVSGYVLMFGLALVPFGRLGDQRSRKTLFLVGLSLFLITSVVCALAPTIEVLIAARLVQGLAAGIQMPQVLGTIQQIFVGKERGRAFGMFGATIGVATAIGPTFGGLMIAVGGVQDGWRWIFWINVPLCALVIAGVLGLLPRTRRSTPGRLQLDPVGLILLAFTIVTLMWPFLFTTGAPTDDPRRWWSLVLFVVFVSAFTWWERRYAASGRSPLVPFSLFSISSFRNGTSAGSEEVQAMVAPLTAPVVTSGRFSVVRFARTIASRSAETVGAMTVTSNVMVEPNALTAVRVTGVSAEIARDTTPEVETTEGAEDDHVSPTPLTVAGSVRFEVTFVSAEFAPSICASTSPRSSAAVVAFFWSAVGMLAETSVDVSATSQNLTSDTSARSSGSPWYSERPR